MNIEWWFQEGPHYTGRARHNCFEYNNNGYLINDTTIFPSSGIGYVWRDGKIRCSLCGEMLPEVLELPAQVFGAYKFDK